MSYKKIQQLLKTYEVADKEYDYDGGEFDEAYENADATEDDQHDELCDWIYGNCNCRKQKLIQDPNVSILHGRKRLKTRQDPPTIKLEGFNEAVSGAESRPQSFRCLYF